LNQRSRDGRTHFNSHVYTQSSIRVESNHVIHVGWAMWIRISNRSVHMYWRWIEGSVKTRLMINMWCGFQMTCGTTKKLSLTPLGNCAGW
jgi:hypothetical protein